MRKDCSAWAAVAVAWLAPLALLGASGGPARGAGELRSCAYTPKGASDVATVPDCASISDSGKLRLSPGRLADLRFDDNGLASVLVGPFAFYVARDGRSAPVAQVDNRAAGFHDGLAPSPRVTANGYKIGYIDETLRLAIPARYDGGRAFDHGRAQVCLGCKVTRDGETADLWGGVWGCIDTAGREVVPVTVANPDELGCNGDGD